MRRTYTVRGKPVEVEQVADVLAINVSSDGVSDEPAASAATFGTPVADAAMAGSSFEAEAFRRAGWVFVRPSADVADAAQATATAPGAEAVGRVYVDGNGRTLVGTDRLTVRLIAGLSLDAAKAKLQAAGLQILRDLKFAPNLFQIRVAAGSDPLDVAAKLQGDADVVYAEPEMIEHVPTRVRPDDPGYGRQWQWRNTGSFGGKRNADVRAERAWETTRGGGVRIAVIDNGFDVTHPDLVDAIVSGAGFFRSAGSAPPSFVASLTGFPDGDHGTFCAGMAVARANNDTGGCGIAHEAELMPIACLGDQVGTQATLARAVAYAVSPQSEGASSATRGADVIACSLGPNNAPWQLSSVLEDALQFAANQGRDGRGTPVFWAVDNAPNPVANDEVCAHPSTIAVGRSTRSDRENGSAFGPELDFLAPGVDVYSTTSGGDYGTDTGTSYACPCAAGIGALVISANPALTGEEVRTILRATCKKIGGVTYENGRHDKYGHGRLTASRAVSAASAADEAVDLAAQESGEPDDAVALSTGQALAALAPSQSGAGEWVTTPPITSKIKVAGSVREVDHSVVDGQALFEGDIVLSRGLEQLGIAITGVGFRWPKRTVVYAIHPDLPNTARVTDAIAHWQQRTLIKFKKRTDERDYVLFRPGNGCSSAMGKIGGVQFITLGPACTEGNAIHEIGHAVGLWHEQSREDRDRHVTIRWENIRPESQHNFNQHIQDGDDIDNYDFGSIMHYPLTAFAIDQSQPTIVPKVQTNEPIGQRAGLSAGDIAAVAKMYASVV